MSRARDFEYMVFTALGTPDPSLAIAACRAGALGVLNLEFSNDQTLALSALTELVEHGRSQFGVLVDGDSPQLLAAILEQSFRGLETVVITGIRASLSEVVETLHEHGLRVLLIATSLEEALAGQHAGIDALIAKGHESVGWVGDETAFVLLQRFIERVTIPVWVQGGIGPHAAAACYVAGAAGVVLDSQVLLTRESPLPSSVKSRISAMDGSETAVFGASFGSAIRAYARPDLPTVDELRRLEASITLVDQPRTEQQRAWRSAIKERVDWNRPDTSFLIVGQDAAFAAGLAKRFHTVGGIVEGMRQAVREQCRSLAHGNPLAEGGPLAQSHGTPYPIVQGPMTRVSDRAEFAAAVAEGGGLPFLALSLMRAPDVDVLLKDTQRLLGNRPWGVGILGFVPQELRDEQLEVTRRYRPPFALIAGGRPAQARVLEQEGISTYLHVPSPGLLRMFLQDGARRFVFEGRECGGHVGPRSSFVLWETMIDVLLDHVPAGGHDSEYHVLFAGGIHDGLSAAMVAAMAAPLVERGVRIGVLLGTAYLFTDEAVQTGAITPGFQKAALNCDRTALLETGPGHATRCAPSPFVDYFEEERRRLMRQQVPREEARNELEILNIGRLRIAAKGMDRHPRFGQDSSAPKQIAVSDQDQWSQGMFMIGQVAALRDTTCTLADLHRDVSVGSGKLLAAITIPDLPAANVAPRPAAIAIVGMGCIVPGAADLRSFWANILNKVDAITEIPPTRWDWRHYFDTDRTARDKVYSRWGGFIDDVPFDPVVYGMPPNSLPSIEPFQLLALAVVRAALQDAGYLDRPFPRERTSVVLGAGGGGADLSSGYVVRSSLPGLFGESAHDLTDRLKGTLPEWTEDSFAGILMNVAAGRVANRFDLGGVNYTVDAACASSLAAVYLAVRDLEAKTSDVVIVGGVDAIQNPFAYLCFSKTQALSPTGHCRAFDAKADGIAISEGFSALVLKRLDDAERDGDRIYAVIRGVGGASDGRDRSLTAPRPEGQQSALRRAYAQAGFSASTVGLIEAHGTGTVAGDQAEVQALTTYFDESGAERQRCAIGSVKSMIGHTKAAAGVAGLTKVALSLYHRVLPPTLGVTEPNPKANFPTSPFYVNSETRPWVHGDVTTPRRAGVSSFGFGGTNFHIVAEEYTGNFLANDQAVVDPQAAELFIWRGRSRAELLESLAFILQKLDRGAQLRLADLAYTVTQQAGGAEAGQRTLSIVADSVSDLGDKMLLAQAMLQGSDERQHTPRGIHYAERPLALEGKIAFLFPGQGSQYVNMARDIAVLFPEVRACFDRADHILAGRLPQPLSRYIFPPPAFTPEEEKAQQIALTETNIAQPALGAAEIAWSRLLRSFGLEPEMTAGHSYAEFVALSAAGCFGEETLLLLSEARGRYIREGTTEESGTMAAVDASPEELRPLLAGLDVTEANRNAPRQTVISGARRSVEQAIERCAEKGLRARLLPVACAFHSPLVAPARQQLADPLAETPFAQPNIPVFSNTTAAAYPDEPDEIVGLLSDHLTSPVDFVKEVQAMYQAGARVFVEVGPRNVLSGLVSRILGDQPHVCVPVDQAGRPALVQLLHALATLAAEGAPVQTARLFEGRSLRRLELSSLENEMGKPRYTPTTWLIDGGRARPAHPKGGVIEPLTTPLQIAILGGQSVAAAPRVETNGRHSGERVLADRLYVEVTNGTSSHTSIANGRSATTDAVTSNGRPYQQHAERTSPIATNGLHTMNADVGTRMEHPSSNGRGASVPAPSQLAPAIEARSVTLAPVRDMATGAMSERTEVMGQFQQVMQRFLQTQKAVMLAYLGAQEAVAPASDGPPPNAFREAGRLADVGPAASGVALPTRSPVVPTAPTPASQGAYGQAAFVAVTGDDVAISDPQIYGSPPQNGSGGVVDGDDGRPGARVAAVTTTDFLAPTRTLDALGDGPPTRQQLTDQLLAVVSERTGYPTEMLALDADLEADLGIDSIKRVEIAGTIIQTLAMPPDSSPDTERLSSSRTLTEIIDNLVALVSPAVASGREAALPGVKEQSSRPFEVGPVSTLGIGRFTLQSALLPPAGPLAGLSVGGVVIIVDDESGVGERLSAMLESRGHRAVRIVSTPSAKNGSANTLMVVPASHEEAAGLATHLRQQFGAVAALVYLAALRPGDAGIGLDLDRWRARLASELGGLFLVSQALQSDLEHSAACGGAVVLGATSLGGLFAVGAQTNPFYPGQGGIAGFLKSLAQEWPAVRVKAVDVPNDSAERIAGWLLDELLSADGVVEIAYPDGRRSALELVPTPLPGGKVARLDSESVILLTGGARGITAQVALTLAERYRSTLLLVGRTPLPERPEAPDTVGLNEAHALRRALIEQHRRAGLPLTPPAIEASYRRLLSEREVRVTIGRLQESGARFHYHACDVRDEAAFGALIDNLYRTHGKIDGVIHGAGVIEDKLVRDKPLDSFQRVVGTKVDGSVVLASKLRPESLEFLVFFSSVSGRFGNRGQADYAAASEVLNKLAQSLDRSWPGRVVSINWGPWLTTGMVSPEVQRQFAERGVTLIPPDVGCRMLVDELLWGRKGEVEVLIGGSSKLSPSELETTKSGKQVDRSDGPPDAPKVSFPLLMTGGTLTRPAGDTREFLRTLDVAHDHYLQDHRLDDRPVFPFAMAMEMMAEAAAACRPSLDVVEVRNIRVFRGIVVDGQLPLRLVARPHAEAAKGARDGDATVTLDLAIEAVGEPRQMHYQATVGLISGSRPAASRIAEPEPLDAAGPFPLSIADAYRDWLFHGPMFQKIVSIDAVSQQGARTVLHQSSPGECLDGGAMGDWLIDPIMVDSAFQMQVLWARMHWDVTLLPARVGSYRRFASAGQQGDVSGGNGTELLIRHEMRVRPESRSPICHADHFFYGPDGRLLGMLTDVEGTGNRALNRLAGGTRR